MDEGKRNEERRMRNDGERREVMNNVQTQFSIYK